MARVTIEDCVAHARNRFVLIQAAIKRTRQLMEGSRPLVSAKNREAVIALREIAAEQVKPQMLSSKKALPQQPVDELDEAALLEAKIEETGVEAPTEGIEEPQPEAAALERLLEEEEEPEEELDEESDLEEKEPEK